MGWIEAKWRRSEALAEEMQKEQIKLINDKLDTNGLLLRSSDGVKGNELDMPFLSNDTRYTDFATDTYRLASSKPVKGRVFTIVTLSPQFILKHKLNHCSEQILKFPEHDVRCFLIDYHSNISGEPYSSIYGKYSIGSYRLYEDPYPYLNRFSVILKDNFKIRQSYNTTPVDSSEFLVDLYFNFSIVGKYDDGEIREIFVLLDKR